MTKPITLKALRIKLNLKRAALAKMAGVDVSTISRWEENGIPKRGPAKAFLEQIAASANERLAA